METGTSSDQIRLDKWLWYARFFKTRSLASKICKARKIRINGIVSSKASATVKVGDVLTFPKADKIKIVKIEDIGQRRGPAPEAQALYTDLSEPDLSDPQNSTEKTTDYSKPVREPGSGRPTKAERRAIDRLMEIDR
ncbi:RNA-binding S4 domain-containing protein [Kordiimonas sp. SCSIO 12610]|uniref:RNA-binding S4 domain-containing protein n=1 Tax=Kordiimonas sp. SCSIO 12610 TaxID=2829597 RepID=UPI00210E3FC0|nr:RNA-binding S4 domain-containing protein [Kordiimonas sp. SCSIO 12610]UTW55398.1 RNA-binding S4 domain-containing protein [Kordiimonas sp. SCSIO 12610]